jgi:hypothetical protein
MKICYCKASERQLAVDLASKNTNGFQPVQNEDLGWKRGGYDIIYERSKLNNIIQQHDDLCKKDEGSDEDEAARKPPKVYF